MLSRYGLVNIILILYVRIINQLIFLELHFENYLTHAPPDATIKITLIPSDRIAILKSINTLYIFNR